MRSPADPLGARAGALTPIHASPEPAGSPHVRPFLIPPAPSALDFYPLQVQRQVARYRAGGLPVAAQHRLDDRIVVLSVN